MVPASKFRSLLQVPVHCSSHFVLPTESKMSVLRNAVKEFFATLGYSLISVEADPRRTLLGFADEVKTIIDVGANIGQFARAVSRVCPEATIYCFEPLAAPFEELQKWATSSQASTVHAIQLALGEAESESEMFVHSQHDTSSSLLATTPRTAELYPFTAEQTKTRIRVGTLDNFFAQHPVPLKREIMIKLDVQGYEDRVVRGGMETFRKARVCILEIAIEELYVGQPNFATMVNLLGQLGYGYVGNYEQYYDPRGRVLFLDAVFAR
jgi:FkbM family methyltransferase